MEQKITFDYSLLKGKIKEKFDTNKNFACLLGFTEANLSYKLNNKTGFSQEEIVKCSKLLNLSAEETTRCFFTLNVRN